MSEPLLRVWNLTKEFPLKGGLFGRQAGSVYAIDGVDFDIDRGETPASSANPAAENRPPGAACSA
jgi:ABC-type oligopeptide transport system ATPase subunit